MARKEIVNKDEKTHEISNFLFIVIRKVIIEMLSFITLVEDIMYSTFIFCNYL